jgi:anti-anti-sigma factor
MNFTIEHRDGLVIFTLKSHNLDTMVAPQIKAEVLIVCQPDIKGLVFDMSQVEYVDSSGLGAMLLAHRQLKDTDAALILVGVQDLVRTMLNISQLEELFEFYDTIEEAEATFNDEE